MNLIENFAERLANCPHRLARAMLVLNQRETDVGIAVFAEADARRHGHFRLLQEEFGKLDGAHLLQWLRYLRPDKHRPARLLYLPADAVEAVDESVATPSIRLADILDAVLRTVQRLDCGDLHRLENAVVEITLD